MIFQYEIKKIISAKLFIFTVFTLLGLLIWMAYAQYANGIIYEDIEGNQTPFYGADFIRHDKRASSAYNGRTVDTDFLLDMQTDSWAFLEDTSAERISGTSIYEFYLKFDTDLKTVIGEIDIDPKDMFGERLPVYYYTGNWYRIISAVANVTTLFLFITVILSAQVFSAEYTSGAFLGISPTKNGRRTLAKTKIAATLAVVSVAFFVTAALTVLIFGGVFGFEHASADIRVFTNGAYFHMPAGISCFTLLCVEVLFCYIAVLCTCAVSLFFSACIPSVYTAFIAAPLLLFLPNICNLDRIHVHWVSVLYNVWPPNFLYLPTSDWYTRELGLPMFGWLGIYGIVIGALLWGAAHMYARHHM